MICRRCGKEPAYPGQRWGKACMTAYVRARRQGRQPPPPPLPPRKFLFKWVLNRFRGCKFRRERAEEPRRRRSRVGFRVRRLAGAARLILRERWGSEQRETYLRDGQPVIIEGGPNTGKSQKLQALARQYAAEGERVLVVDALLPLGDILANLPGKRLSDRIPLFLRQCEGSILLLDNAYLAATQGRKLDLLVRAVERAKRVVVTCSRVGELPWRLRARLDPKIPRVVPLGSGGRTFDATYILVAMALVFLVMADLHAYVFLAAAVRYLFWGIRRGET